MRTRTDIRGRLAALALCACIGSAGCGTGQIDFDEPAEALPADFMADLIEFLAPETCVIVTLAWYPQATVETADKRCGNNGRALNSGLRVNRVANGTGAFVLDSLLIEGAVAGNQLPRWTAIMSATPEVPGSGTYRALASVTATDDEGEPTGSVPAKILATLYDVDRKGKREKVGKKKASFDKKTGGAQVVFDKLEGPRHHYEIDLVVKGGKVTSGSLNYGASATAQHSQRPARVAGRWTDGPGFRAGATPVTTWAGVGISTSGKTSAGQIPKTTIAAYPDQSNRVAGRSATFDVLGLAMQADDKIDPPKQQLKKVQFKLYAVNAQGKRTLVATKTGNVAKKNGVAFIVIEGVAAPASHYEIEAKPSGGKMQDSNLSLSVLVAPAGLAGRLARSGTLAGAR